MSSAEHFTVHIKYDFSRDVPLLVMDEFQPCTAKINSCFGSVHSVSYRWEAPSVLYMSFTKFYSWNLADFKEKHNRVINYIEHSFAETLRQANSAFYEIDVIGAEIVDITMFGPLTKRHPEITNLAIGRTNFGEHFDCSSVKEYLPKLQSITFRHPPSKVLELFKNPNLYIVSADIMDLKPLCKIITRHLQDGRNVAACQTELLKNGFKQYIK